MKLHSNFQRWVGVQTKKTFLEEHNVLQNSTKRHDWGCQHVAAPITGCSSTISLTALTQPTHEWMWIYLPDYCVLYSWTKRWDWSCQQVAALSMAAVLALSFHHRSVSLNSPGKPMTGCESICHPLLFLKQWCGFLMSLPHKAMYFSKKRTRWHNLRIQPPLLAPAASLSERGKQPERGEAAVSAGYRWQGQLTA